MRVQFLIAGVQKAGTTALDRFLRQHAYLSLPSRKEVHFFDNEQINWQQPDYREYHRFFSEKPGQISGEATPIYTYWPPSLARIHAYNPDMKLIVCLRDPVARAYSHWEMEVSRGYENLKFRAAIRKGRSRVTGDERSLAGAHRVYSYVERGFYSAQIERLLELFPRENLLFLENSHIKNNLKDVLNTITDFLHVPAYQTYPENKIILPTQKRQNLGSISEEDKAYLAGLYRDDTKKTARLTGLDISHWARA
ncbi:sulfotransferase domain-containing protein [Kordiimonas pumila]|uniref:Sulfotransferase domain-containing protein n=1 Tax=Kordiimonas pumila TaxID=2161677 RepID=A0ABV7D4S9_9PROT|nr:sulfotransferase domain-containing protein [Kordiimonas pumila]